MINQSHRVAGELARRFFGAYRSICEKLSEGPVPNFVLYSDFSEFSQAAFIILGITPRCGDVPKFPGEREFWIGNFDFIIAAADRLRVFRRSNIARCSKNPQPVGSGYK